MRLYTVASNTCTTCMYDREESIERRHTVHQMYAESNVTCHKLGICTLTNLSVGDVIYFQIQEVTLLSAYI